MAWNVWLCDTRTGANRVRVQPASSTWQRVLNAGGSGQSDFRLLDPATRLAVTRASTLPLAKSVVMDWDGNVVYAGPIWARKYVRATGVLEVRHADIWSFLPFRHAVITNANDVGQTALVIPKAGLPTLTLASIAKTLVFEGQDAASEMYRLPIDFPADAIGNYRRTYHGYDLPTVQDALQDLMESAGGPDVDFRPYWTSDGRLRYEMRVGSLRQGTWSWNLAAGKTDAHDVTVTEDANNLAVNTFGIGLGSEKRMVLRADRNNNSPYPVLERRIEHKDVSSESVMDGLIAEHLRVHANPTEQWSMSMLAGGTPAVTDLRLGGTTRQYFKDDPWIPDGWQENRLIQYAGDLGHSVSLGFQTLGGA